MRHLCYKNFLFPSIINMRLFLTSKSAMVKIYMSTWPDCCASCLVSLDTAVKLCMDVRMYILTSTISWL